MRKRHQGQNAACSTCTSKVRHAIAARALKVLERLKTEIIAQYQQLAVQGQKPGLAIELAGCVILALAREVGCQDGPLVNFGIIFLR